MHTQHYTNYIRKILGALTILSVFFLLAPSAHAAINCNASTANTAFINNTTPFTLAGTTVAGSNKTIVMTVFWWSNSGTITIGTPTYGGVNMTLGSTNRASSNPNGGYMVSTFYLASPPTGSQTASVPFSSASYGTLGIVQMTGTNTASPLDNTGGVYQSSSVTSLSTNITTNFANSCLVDAMGANNTFTSITSSQNTLYTQNGSSDASSWKSTTTAGTYAMAWSWTTAGELGQSIIAIRELAATPSVVHSIAGLVRAFWW